MGRAGATGMGVWYSLTREHLQLMRRRTGRPLERAVFSVYDFLGLSEVTFRELAVFGSGLNFPDGTGWLAPEPLMTFFSAMVTLLYAEAAQVGGLLVSTR